MKGNLREVFIADPGKKLVICDLAQIEPRVMAHYSQDPLLLDTFRSGKDFYAIIANEVLGLRLQPEFLYKKAFKDKYEKEREFGKTTGLSISYGIGPGKFAWAISKATGQTVTWKQGKDYIDAYLNAFVGITELRKACYEEVAKNGFLSTLFGRKVYISKEEALHKGVNWKIQPSASDVCLFSQLWVKEELKRFKFDAELLLLVHDEVVYQVPEEQAELFAKFLEAIMTKGIFKYLPEAKFSVPLEAEIAIGDNWGAKK